MGIRMRDLAAVIEYANQVLMILQHQHTVTPMQFRQVLTAVIHDGKRLRDLQTTLDKLDDNLRSINNSELEVVK